MKTAYICDGRAPCAKANGCIYGDTPFRTCNHTVNTLYAKNGACAHPEKYPERFKVVGQDADGQPMYWEIDKGGIHGEDSETGRREQAG